MYNGDGRERSLILLSYSRINKTRLRFDVRGLFEARKVPQFDLFTRHRGVPFDSIEPLITPNQLTCRSTQR